MRSFRSIVRKWTELQACASTISNTGSPLFTGFRQLDDTAHEEGKQDPVETAEAADTFASTLPLSPKGLSLRNAGGDEIEDY